MPKPQMVRDLFCGQDQAQATKLIAGPHVFICDACVSLAREVISSSPT